MALTADAIWADRSAYLRTALDVVMKDYDAIRTEIRTSEGRHERVLLWLSSGLLAVTVGLLREYNDLGVGFCFLPLIILAYYAHRFFSHTLLVRQLSSWIKRTEHLVDKIMHTRGLLNWEREWVRYLLEDFAPPQDVAGTNEQRPATAKSRWRSLLHKLLSPHWFAEVLMLLPSGVVFCFSLGAACYYLVNVQELPWYVPPLVIGMPYAVLILGAILVLRKALVDGTVPDWRDAASSTYESLRHVLEVAGGQPPQAGSNHQPVS